MPNPPQTIIKSSFLFSDGKFKVYLVINYLKKTFTLKRSGYNSGNNETSFIFKDTKNDTRGLLQLMIEAQEFALLELGGIKVSFEVRKTDGEAQWDETLIGTMRYKEPKDNSTIQREDYQSDEGYDKTDKLRTAH